MQKTITQKDQRIISGCIRNFNIYKSVSEIAQKLKKLDHTYSSFSYRSHIFAFSIAAGSVFLLCWINPFSLIKVDYNMKRFPSGTPHNTFDLIDISSWETKYAEANPDAAINPADSTNLLSFKNQQAAQPKEKKHVNKNALVPESDGESNNLKVIPRTDIDNKKTTTDPIVTVPALIPQKLPPVATTGKLNPNDLPDKSGKGFSFSGPRKPSKLIRLSSANEETTLKPDEELEPIKGIIHRTRPRLSQQVLNGPVLQNRASAPRIGKVAIECRLHPYGIYMQEMLKSIESQWTELIKNSFRYLQLDRLPSSTTYRFTLLSSGQIKELEIRGNTDGYSLSQELCRQAIASRAPFGQWDETMIKELGQSDEIVITFNYK